jgi:hypothetical protein
MRTEGFFLPCEFCISMLDCKWEGWRPCRPEKDYNRKIKDKKIICEYLLQKNATKKNRQ